MLDFESIMQAGQFAAQSDKPFSSCPYKAGSLCAEVWMDAWNEAYDAMIFAELEAQSEVD